MKAMSKKSIFRLGLMKVKKSGQLSFNMMKKHMSRIGLCHLTHQRSIKRKYTENEEVLMNARMHVKMGTIGSGTDLIIMTMIRIWSLMTHLQEYLQVKILLMLNHWTRSKTTCSELSKLSNFFLLKI